jgi:glycosyltransferase involved in cell wall biosynthesis
MLSGDRQTAAGEQGPFWVLHKEFSRYFERVDVICPRPIGPAVVDVIHERVHLHPASGGRAGMVGHVVRRGRELIAGGRPGLIVSHDYGWFYNGLGAARLSAATGVPYLSELHHVPGHPVAADWRERLDKLAARAYVRFAMSRARAFRVVNATEMPALLRRWGVPAEKILVVPSLYIDLETFAPAPAASGPPLPEHDVLFVGRLVGNKGLERIVDALALLARRGPRRSVLFVGRGPLRARIEARAAAAGVDARFVDWLATPAALADAYRRARVLVCASTCEGGPRVTVEAMACGTPVVSTPVGVMPELLADGRAGVLAGFDVESLAAGVAEVLADEGRRRARGRAARQAVLGYEYRARVRDYAEALIRLAEGEARGTAA